MKGRILFSIIGLVAVTAPAAAEMPVVRGERPDDAAYTRVVRFDDLDIATPAGEKLLMQRVRGAVGYVCAGAANFSVESRCRGYAWKGARPQLTRALELAQASPALATAALASIRISAPR